MKMRMRKTVDLRDAGQHWGYSCWDPTEKCRDGLDLTRLPGLLWYLTCHWSFITWSVDKRFLLELLCFSLTNGWIWLVKMANLFSGSRKKIVRKHSISLVESCLLSGKLFLGLVVIAFSSFLTRKLEQHKARKRLCLTGLLSFCLCFCLLRQCFEEAVSSASHWHSL